MWPSWGLNHQSADWRTAKSISLSRVEYGGSCSDMWQSWRSTSAKLIGGQPTRDADADWGVSVLP